MDQVLNPVLFRTLTRVFGKVRISHQGESRITLLDEDLDGRVKEFVLQDGEQYLVRCRFCHDEAQQLSINHMFGTQDDNGRLRTYLAWCHNAGCMKDRRRQNELLELLFPVSVPSFLIRPGKDRRGETVTLSLPPKTIPLDELGAQHRAVKYLARLGLNADRMASAYELGYCPSSADDIAANRIVVPVYQRGPLCGWEALSLDGDPYQLQWPKGSKYLSAPEMKRSALVYNLDQARNYQTGVIVSEQLEVWKFGKMAICPLGREWTEKQMQSLVAAFRERNLVLLVRRHESRQIRFNALQYKLKSVLGMRFIVAELPENRSPLQYDRAVLRAIVRKEAARRGVEVLYRQQETPRKVRGG